MMMRSQLDEKDDNSWRGMQAFLTQSDAIKSLRETASKKRVEFPFLLFICNNLMLLLLGVLLHAPTFFFHQDPPRLPVNGDDNNLFPSLGAFNVQNSFGISWNGIDDDEMLE